MIRLRHCLSVLLLTLCALLGSCASVEPLEYVNEKPLLDLKSYFNGTITGHGMFQDRSGKVVKRFVVTIQCTWVGNVGTLDEAFVYSDGTKQHRIWTITEQGAGRYTGTASDIVGRATGQREGNAIQWHYTFAFPVDGKVYNVRFNDWMYLIDERVMLNRAVMSKFGFRLGEVTLSFTRS